MTARFEVRHRPAKGCRFVLTATDGQVIATRRYQETHRSCPNGVDSVEHDAEAPERTIDSVKADLAEIKERAHR